MACGSVKGDRPFFDVLNTRRSIRQFTSEPVPLEVLQTIVQAGLEAPTGCNAQFRHYLIVTDAAVMDPLAAFSKAIDGAPAAIVQLIEPKPTPWGDYHLQDAAASIENMLLAAVALGYASCWIEGQVRRSHDQIRRLLGVPATLDISAILPIGRPLQQPPRPAKATLEQVTHYNLFGKQKE